MRRVDPLQLQFEQERLRTGQWLAPVDGLLDEHELGEDVIDDS